MKKHFFLWNGSSCYGPDSVFTRVTESSIWIQFSRHFVLWGFLEPEVLELWKNSFLSAFLKQFHKACWPDWEDQRSYTWNRAGRTCLSVNHRGAHKEVGSNFKCFQLLLLFTAYYCSHAITNLPLSKATGRNRRSSSTQHGTEWVKVTQFYHSWWVFLFSSSSSFPQKNTHIIFTLGVSASLVLLFRQLPGCKPALQNQILPFILGFAFIILAWISYFFHFLLLYVMPFFFFFSLLALFASCHSLFSSSTIRAEWKSYTLTQVIYITVTFLPLKNASSNQKASRSEVGQQLRLQFFELRQVTRNLELQIQEALSFLKKIFCLSKMKAIQ